MNCSEFMFFKVQTNRISIKKLLAEFRENLSSGEQLIAPRPLPRESFKYYCALARVKPDGTNIARVRKFKACRILTMEEYETEKGALAYVWAIGIRNA